MAYFQVNDKCNGCLACLQNCPANAIDVRDSGAKRTLFHNMALCARCGNCWRICPQHAVEFQHMLANRWDEVIALDLIYCRECEEPLYTAAFKEKLSGKKGILETPLCSRHKEALALKVNVHFPGYKSGQTR